MEEGRRAFAILAGKAAVKTPLGTLIEWTLKKQVSIRGIE